VSSLSRKLSRSWSKDKTAPVNHHDYGQKDRIAPANRQDYSQKDKAAGAITCPYHWDLLTLHHQVTPGIGKGKVH